MTNPTSPHPLIGRTGVLELARPYQQQPRALVRVVITDVTPNFGRIDCTVTPIEGSKSLTVSLDSIALDPITPCR